jgi:peptidyl-tRNA hydrolase, PTH1 family
MRLLVGLGNPDPQHRYNRHNVGFMAVDAIVERHDLGSWRSFANGLGTACKGIISNEEVLLLKPLTYMNGSGAVVQETAKFYKLGLKDIVVFHDEIELPPAKLKMRLGGGSRGHNGLRSITAHVGNDYFRVGIGVGRPEQRHGVDAYVLGNFMPDERSWVETMLRAIAVNAGLIASRRDQEFPDEVNLVMEAHGFDDKWRRHRVDMNRNK